MCRHLAYVGPSVTLSSLVIEPEHSLFEQTWSPADMRGGGSVNADGFGLGWYVDGQAVRYRRDVPIWTDDNLPGLARTIRSGALLAAVRNGTDGMPHTEATVAPFVDGNWLFSHNGRIAGWPGSVLKLAEQLPVSDLLRLDAPVDAALVFALITHRLSKQPPAPEQPPAFPHAVASDHAAEVVASVVRDIEAAAPGSRLNLLLTDGEQVIATCWTHSLWVRRTADSITVASEPCGTPRLTANPSLTASSASVGGVEPGRGWVAVPDRTLLTATATTLHLTPMEGRQ